jgi:hypothetical protein
LALPAPGWNTISRKAVSWKLPKPVMPVTPSGASSAKPEMVQPLKVIPLVMEGLAPAP